MLPNLSRLSVRVLSPQTENIGYWPYWVYTPSDLHETVFRFDNESPEAVLKVLTAMPSLEGSTIWFSERWAKEATIALYTAALNHLVQTHGTLLENLIPRFEYDVSRLITGFDPDGPDLDVQIEAATYIRSKLIGACRFIRHFQLLRYKSLRALGHLIRSYGEGVGSADPKRVDKLMQRYDEGTQWFRAKTVQHRNNNDENKLAFVIFEASKTVSAEGEQMLDMWTRKLAMAPLLDAAAAASATLHIPSDEYIINYFIAAHCRGLYQWYYEYRYNKGKSFQRHAIEASRHWRLHENAAQRAYEKLPKSLKQILEADGRT